MRLAEADAGMDVVADALQRELQARINHADGELSKVVLARDLRGSIPEGSDLRRLVRALASGYPDTWAFAVDGLIGAATWAAAWKEPVT